MDPYFVSTLEDEYFLNRCSADDFRMGMPGAVGCYELPRETTKHGQLTVFCYPAKTNAPPESSGINSGKRGGGSNISQHGSLQDKIKSFLLLDKLCWTDNALVQFWTPRTTPSGQILLTASEQPFGLGRFSTTASEQHFDHLGPFYEGLCRYRYYCIQQGDLVEDISQLGPLGRVFTRGYLEHCLNIKCYITEEFPMRDYAIKCGIGRYWALPLFELGGQQQHCVGVLEGVSFGIEETSLLNSFDLILKELEVRVKLLYSQGHITDVLKSLSYEHGLPLIQVWVPCMCDDIEAFVEGDDQNTCSFSNSTTRINSTHLFAHSTFLDWKLKYAMELHLMIRECSVKNGKALVGKAYWQKKSCFSRDTSEFSILDYPLVPYTRSSGLTACFAIPLQLIRPDLPHYILEVFLPPQQKCDVDPQDVLKSLLSTISWENEEFSLKISHSDDDNFVYFDVDRIGETMNGSKALVSSGRDELPFQSQLPTLQHNVVVHYESKDHEAATATARREKYSILNPNAQSRSETSDGAFTNFDAQLFTSDAIRSGQLQVAAENLGTNQVQSHEVVSEGTYREELQQYPMGAGVNNYENNDTGRKKNSWLCPNSQNKVFTYDDLKLHFGKNLDEAAAACGVSRSTLKRICRGFGIERWPHRSRKRNKVDDNIQSNPSLPARSAEVGSEVIQESEINAREIEVAAENSIPSRAKYCKSKPTREEGIGRRHSYTNTMTVKATYGDDTVLFSLRSHSRLEELRGKLDERFQLQADQRFKIKYEYEGDWIMIACDEDLSFGMDTLKSSGQTTMKLSVFPAATL